MQRTLNPPQQTVLWFVRFSIFRFVIKSDYFVANYSPRTSLESSPDPDLASIEGEILSAGRLDGNGFNRGGIRTAGWFSQAEGGYVLAWSNTHTHTVIVNAKIYNKNY